MIWKDLQRHFSKKKKKKKKGRKGGNLNKYSKCFYMNKDILEG